MARGVSSALRAGRGSASRPSSPRSPQRWRGAGSRCLSPASRAAARARRRSGSCCWKARRAAGTRVPRPCCSPPPAPTMSKRPSARRWSAGNGCCRDRFLDSSLAYQGEAGGLGIEAVRDLHRFGSHDFLPDRTLVLTLDEAEGATRRASATAIPATASVRGRRATMPRSMPAFRPIAERGAGAGAG